MALSCFWSIFRWCSEFWCCFEIELLLLEIDNNSARLKVSDWAIADGRVRKEREKEWSERIFRKANQVRHTVHGNSRDGQNVKGKNAYLFRCAVALTGPNIWIFIRSVSLSLSHTLARKLAHTLTLSWFFSLIWCTLFPLLFLGRNRVGRSLFAITLQARAIHQSTYGWPSTHKTSDDFIHKNTPKNTKQQIQQRKRKKNSLTYKREPLPLSRVLVYLLHAKRSIFWRKVQQHRAPRQRAWAQHETTNT